MEKIEAIESKMAEFCASLDAFRLMSPEMKEKYIALKRYLLETQQISAEELVARAQRIKPLIRIDEDEYTFYADFCDVRSLPKNGLVFIQPEDLRESFFYNFKPKKALRDKDTDKVIPVKGVKEISRFICYHSYKNGVSIVVCPCADEVLAQLPQNVCWQDIDAFEIMLCEDISSPAYLEDPVLRCHVSTVILYQLEGGLPKQVCEQPVILDGKIY